jgi:FKBP-type peptidyl-prolyl cis-trans isomerase
MLPAVLAALTVGLVACNEENPFEVIEDVTFNPSLGVDLSAMTRLPEGMYIQDRVVGTGPGLAAGDSAWVYYELYLRTGAPIENGLFGFEFRTTNLIEGWDIGLAGMMAGGTRLLVIPPELGYGEQPVGGVRGAVLVFEVELDSIT